MQIVMCQKIKLVNHAWSLQKGMRIKVSEVKFELNMKVTKIFKSTRNLFMSSSFFVNLILSWAVWRCDILQKIEKV